MNSNKKQKLAEKFPEMVEVKKVLAATNERIKRQKLKVRNGGKAEDQSLLLYFKEKARLLHILRYLQKNKVAIDLHFFNYWKCPESFDVMRGTWMSLNGSVFYTTNLSILIILKQWCAKLKQAVQELNDQVRKNQSKKNPLNAR